MNDYLKLGQMSEMHGYDVTLSSESVTVVCRFDNDRIDFADVKSALEFFDCL